MQYVTNTPPLPKVTLTGLNGIGMHEDSLGTASLYAWTSHTDMGLTLTSLVPEDGGVIRVIVQEDHEYSYAGRKHHHAGEPITYGCWLPAMLYTMHLDVYCASLSPRPAKMACPGRVAQVTVPFTVN